MELYTITKRPNKYKCCLEINLDKENSYSIYYLNKYYYNNIIDDIYKFYIDKKNYDKDIKKKFLYLHKIYSLYYLKRFELNYCLKHFDVLGYLENIDCIKKDFNINCLYKDMECCNDNEFNVLCKCIDRYPIHLPDINVTLEITGLIDEKFINLKNSLNYNLQTHEYFCCNGGGIEFVSITSGVPNITNIVFNNNKFDSIKHISNNLTLIDELPYTEEIIITYRYCEQYIVKQKVIFNYITNCQDLIANYTTSDIKQIDISYNESLSNNIDFQFFTSPSFIDCCNKGFHSGGTVNINSYSYDNKHANYFIISSVYYLSGKIYINYQLKSELFNLTHFTKISKCKYKLDIPVNIEISICNKIINYTAIVSITYHTDELYEYQINTYLLYSFFNSSLPYVLQNNSGSSFYGAFINQIHFNSCCNGDCNSQIKYNKILFKLKTPTNTYQSYINLIDTSGNYITFINNTGTSPNKNINLNLNYSDLIDYIIINDEYDCRSGYNLAITLNPIAPSNLYFTPHNTGDEIEIYIDYSIYICNKEFKFLKKVLIIK